MLSAYETALIYELERRELINHIIDFILTQSYRFTDNKFNRVKRGEVHLKVAKEMGVDLNNTLCGLIRDRIEDKGGVPKNVAGSLVYLHVKAL
jgi:hypothetical protein